MNGSAASAPVIRSTMFAASCTGGDQREPPPLRAER